MTISYILKRHQIPTIIWQTGADDYDKLKEPFNQNVLTWQRMNPKWKYVYKNEFEKVQDIQEFGNETFSELATLVYGPYLADLWRYVMLYKFGGVYADLDSVCWLPMDLLGYIFENDRTCTWVTPEGDWGYVDNSKPVQMTTAGSEICEPCRTFQSILGTGESSNGKKWLGNGAFATYQEAPAMKNVLDEVEYRFKLFKELHPNGYNASHSAINSSVDCAAFDAGIHRDLSTVSRTFVGDIQGTPPHGDQGGAFKTYFDDYNIITINHARYSELEEIDVYKPNRVL